LTQSQWIVPDPKKQWRQETYEDGSSYIGQLANGRPMHLPVTKGIPLGLVLLKGVNPQYIMINWSKIAFIDNYIVDNP